MNEGKKYEPIPLWLDRKLLKRMGVMGAENKDLLRGYRYGSHECFEILWPLIELMHAALVWNAHTIVLDNIYDNESNNANFFNLLRCVKEAKEALKKVEEMK